MYIHNYTEAESTKQEITASKQSEIDTDTKEKYEIQVNISVKTLTFA